MNEYEILKQTEKSGLFLDEDMFSIRRCSSIYGHRYDLHIMSMRKHQDASKEHTIVNMLNERRKVVKHLPTLLPLTTHGVFTETLVLHWHVKLSGRSRA